MKRDDIIITRANQQCELCSSTLSLNIYEVPFADNADENAAILLCEKCKRQLEKREELDSKHWQCLKESMWSEVNGVKVTAWRVLNRLRNESWAVEDLEMLYLDDELLTWAKATGDHENDSSVELHKDVNGQILESGDTVVVIKDLDVKGSSINAKVGTVVKNIRLVENNIEQIEGKVDGQMIVILTKYLRKQK